VARAGGRGPAYAEVALSWARDEAEAVRVAHERFRFGLLGWRVMADLPNPSSFEAATRWVRREDVAEQIPCGPDAERHLAAIRRYRDAGFDHVVLIGIAPDQDGFLRFWRRSSLRGCAVTGVDFRAWARPICAGDPVAPWRGGRGTRLSPLTK